MADYMIKTRREIAADRLSDMHAADAAAGKGRAVLEVKVYYYKDARIRGVYLSVSRCLADEGWASYDLMNKHNGLILIERMDRKPSVKAAAKIIARIESRMDEIAAFAMSSDAPAWGELRAALEHVNA